MGSREGCKQLEMDQRAPVIMGVAPDKCTGHESLQRSDFDMPMASQHGKVVVVSGAFTMVTSACAEILCFVPMASFLMGAINTTPNYPFEVRRTKETYQGR
jgi:hypothetical protein